MVYSLQVAERLLGVSLHNEKQPHHRTNHYEKRVSDSLLCISRCDQSDVELVDLANVTDLRLQTGCAIGSRSPSLVSKLSFSLMSGSELSLLDLDSVHSAQLAEWTDGIRVLRGEGGMKMPETANYVHVGVSARQKDNWLRELVDVLARF